VYIRVVVEVTRKAVFVSHVDRIAVHRCAQGGVSMKTLKSSMVVLGIALVAMVRISHAAQPPNVVTSDAAGNTAMGGGALQNITQGAHNTASGNAALYWNSTGSNNTGTGFFALPNNTTGFNNTASGAYALYTNTTGYFNTATGYFALLYNTTGFDNTASGHLTLANNTEGNANTASGADALSSNTTGRNNVAIGKSALLDNTIGRNNIAIGWYAGRRTDGNDNILIAHKGVAGESQTMRLGVKGTAGVAGSGITRTYIAGIKGVTTGLPGSAVMIDANGQLGTVSSSREVKENIRPMGNASERLLALRPVIFQYRQANQDGSKPIQFGLIAEDVAEVFPELVIYNEEGKPETVAYHLLATLLLNEFQKSHNIAQQQAIKIAELERQSAELAQLKQQVAALSTIIEQLNRTARVANTH
jgi:hypothetical protein